MKARHIVAGIYFAALLFVWAWFCGAMVRREMSPWVWEEYASNVRKHGQADALFSVALFLLFYSGGFAFPFVIVRAIARSVIESDHCASPRTAMAGVNAGAFLIAAASELTFIIFLRAIVAFFANLPSDIWNGWLLILWMGLTTVLVWTGITALHNASKKR